MTEFPFSPETTLTVALRLYAHKQFFQWIFILGQSENGDSLCNILEITMSVGLLRILLFLMKTKVNDSPKFSDCKFDLRLKTSRNWFISKTIFILNWTWVTTKLFLIIFLKRFINRKVIIYMIILLVHPFVHMLCSWHSLSTAK